MRTQLSPTAHLSCTQRALSLGRVILGLNPLPISNTAQSKIRMPTKTGENIANVISGLHAFVEGTVPSRDNSVNNFDSCKVGIVHGDLEPVLILGNEMIVIRLTRWRTIKVGP